MKDHEFADNLISDRELLRRIARRDQDALSELYNRYCNLVYSLAFHTLQNSVLAEEVTQDTFIKVWKQPDRWNPDYGKFSSWLLTVTRHTAIDRLRREQRQTPQLILLLENVPDEAEDGYFWNEEEAGKELRILINQLPVEQAEVIRLAFFKGMTHSQIAEVLNLPLGTVKTRVRLGLSKLKTDLIESLKIE
jgi:RNA polymerase sigma-70 factor (ECF subfamily)